MASNAGSSGSCEPTALPGIEVPADAAAKDGATETDRALARSSIGRPCKAASRGGSSGTRRVGWESDGPIEDDLSPLRRCERRTG